MSYAMEQPIALRASESARAAFIRRTYGHLAGAILVGNLHQSRSSQPVHTGRGSLCPPWRSPRLYPIPGERVQEATRRVLDSAAAVLEGEGEQVRRVGGEHAIAPTVEPCPTNGSCSVVAPSWPVITKLWNMPLEMLAAQLFV